MKQLKHIVVLLLVAFAAWTPAAKAAAPEEPGATLQWMVERGNFGDLFRGRRVAVHAEFVGLSSGTLQSPAGRVSQALRTALGEQTGARVIPPDSTEIVMNILALDRDAVIANSVYRDKLLGSMGASGVIFVKITSDANAFRLEFRHALRGGEMSDAVNAEVCKGPALRRGLGEDPQEGQFQLQWSPRSQIDIEGPCGHKWSSGSAPGRTSIDVSAPAGTWTLRGSSPGFETQTMTVYLPARGTQTVSLLRFDTPHTWLKAPILSAVVPGSEVGYYGNRAGFGSKTLAVLSALAVYSGITYELLADQGVFERDERLARLKGTSEDRRQVRLATRIAYGVNVACGLKLGISHRGRHLSLGR